jgi:hypothetical protein
MITLRERVSPCGFWPNYFGYHYCNSTQKKQKKTVFESNQSPEFSDSLVLYRGQRVSPWVGSQVWKVSKFSSDYRYDWFQHFRRLTGLKGFKIFVGSQVWMISKWRSSHQPEERPTWVRIPPGCKKVGKALQSWWVFWLKMHWLCMPLKVK